MRGERAQLGVTSPPYAVGKEYEAGVSFSDHLTLLRGFADRALDTLDPGGFLFVNFGEIAAQSHTKPLTGSGRQCIYPISKDYWQIFHEERRMDLYAMRIWYKPFNRLQQPFWSYHTSIPHHQEWEHIWTWRLPGGDDDQVYDWDISSRAVWDTRNEATDDKPLTRHVAAFPVGIPERAIRAHSAEGALVWEPFSGSGTTLVVCEQQGRLCRACELDRGYLAVTLERLVGLGLTPRLVDRSED
jgi:DNA modification methylase